ncbi:MAG: regulatory protein RecX [Candidatus Binatia bacterium]
MKKWRAARLTREQAMDVAFGVLARRARSAAEVRATLIRRGASASLAARVLQRLRALGYVDDEKLAAEETARLRERGFGSLRIHDQLLRRQIAEKIVERVTPGVTEERELARRVLTRRFGEQELEDRSDLARAARFLAGRGFPAEIIDSLFDVWELRKDS